MEQIDLSFFLEPPVLDTAAVLTVEALAPLSMVPSQPGAYYRSQAHPTNAMLYGMLENALGWHFEEKERLALLKALRKAAASKHKKQAAWKDSDWLSGKNGDTGGNFSSLLAYHLRFGTSILPEVMEYDDFWSQHLREEGARFMGGSKHYDGRLERLINNSKTRDSSQPVDPKTKKHPFFVEFGEKADTHRKIPLEESINTLTGKIHFKSVRDAFPQYYVSPKYRGYVVTKSPFQYRILTTTTVAGMLEAALSDPAAPLYLGSNDGWVEANWEQL